MAICRQLRNSVLYCGGTAVMHPVKGRTVRWPAMVQRSTWRGALPPSHLDRKAATFYGDASSK
ncbi:hypothetical protein [Paenibacillus sp. MSJ-34]|uniref:hypothetical protein n=1 Tax=Paenibacillus sp. MSJ-34 TaxID=2841529 RepID=UPI001C128430|nr:hypothetical protein [Paenibacillus sp. MSJ-34]MBU5444945.1 hypothetical protein [Paenibacillus sp. MSJ-34]